MFPFRGRTFVVLVGFVLSVSGCATGRADLLDAGTVDVKLQETPETRIQGISVLQDEGETIVYGRVRRLGNYMNAFSGKQVTAKAIWPDGSVHESTDRLLVRISRTRNFRAIYPVAKFKIVFPQQLPPGTTLVLSFGDRSRES